MTIEKQIRREPIRDIVDILSGGIPLTLICLQVTNIIPNFPERINYSLLAPAFVGIIDVIYRYGFKYRD